jgi:hypothetical protein
MFDGLFTNLVACNFKLMHKSSTNYTSVEVYRRLRYLNMEEKYYNHHFN